MHGKRDKDKVSVMSVCVFVLSASHNLRTDKWKIAWRQLASYPATSHISTECVSLSVSWLYPHTRISVLARCLFDLVDFIMLEKLLPIFYCEIVS